MVRVAETATPVALRKESVDRNLYSGNDELYGYITGQLKVKEETIQKKGGLKWLFGRKRK